MFLQNLHILNFKSIEGADLDFTSGINCFVGDNGAGKTNLLDAIYYLAFCKSFLGIGDAQNIRHHQSFFVLQGNFQRMNDLEQIYCGFKRNQKKQFKRNKKDYERLAEHIGLLPLVMISPNDELLITEGAEERRKYMDGVISQYDRNYLYSLMRYNKLLVQRNAYLKQWREQGGGDVGLLEVLDAQLGMLGNAIHQHRQKFVETLVPVFNQYYHLLSGEQEQVGMVYQSGLRQYDLAQGLLDCRQRDLQLGYTTRGIHKDELSLLLNGYPIKRIGSQGQKKSFLIALKLAQFQFLSRHNGFKPILLLDDIFDKLDLKRGANLIALVADNAFHQIFITDTNRAHLEAVLSGTGKEYRVFNVNNGNVTVAE